MFSIQCLYVFHMFSFVFRMFPYTNILTRCPRPVVVFCIFLVSEILLRKYSRNGLKIHGDQFLPRTKTKTEVDPEGCPGVPRGVPGASPPLARPGGPLEAPGTSSHRLFAYKLPLTLKSSGTEIFSTKHTKRRRDLKSPI